MKDKPLGLPFLWLLLPLPLSSSPLPAPGPRLGAQGQIRKQLNQVIQSTQILKTTPKEKTKDIK